MLNEIVSIINQALNANAFADKLFQKAKFYEIVKSTPIKNASGVMEMFPATISEKGECIKVYPDDKNPIQIYHKVNSMPYGLMKEQVGNGMNNIIRSANMSMIVFGLRSKLKLSDEELDLFIAAKLPERLTKTQLTDLKLKDCTIIYNSVDFNSMSVYAREYNTKEYYLKPGHLFFEVKYTIECRLDKRCINTCENC